MTDSANQVILSDTTLQTSHTEICQSLRAAIAHLRQLTQHDVQTGWKICERDCDVAELSVQATIAAELNEKGYLVWEKGRKVRWFYQEFCLPKDLQGYSLSGLTLRLALTWWAEFAEVFVNGEKVQEGDLFDHSCRVVLSHAVVPGEVVAVGVRLVSPGHDIGGLMKSRLMYESGYDTIDPGFVADELAVVQSYLETFAPEELGEVAQAVCTSIAWDGATSGTELAISDRSQFDQSLQNLRDRLLPFSDRIKHHTIYMVGHAHLDMAWLWDVDETWRAAERTFQSVLNLQDEFPDLTFCHSTPALYEWIEQNRPELFARIQERVKEGRWEVVGGLWVEPEMNLISGEAIARHILYGQRYYQERFGEINRVAWLPDTFGFNWQLPQLLKQGGMDYFVTQKFRWNDTNKYPYEVFDWQAPDGSTVFSLMSGPIGEGIDPVSLSAYAWEWATRTGTFHSLWLPGVGDHGGGPTRDMLTIAKRWEKSPFFPTLKFTTALEYLELLKNRDVRATNVLDSTANDHYSTTNDQHSPTQVKHSTVNDQHSTANVLGSAVNVLDSTVNDQHSNGMNQASSPISVWNDELYLEFHRGCYTTHSDQKRFNRRCEVLLYQAELFASLATLMTGASYPKAALETAWKKTLFNQFHDILPGSSITKVFVDANQEWQDVEQICTNVREQALTTIAQQIALPSPPHPDAKAIVVFNPSNWQRSNSITVSTVELADKNHWKIVDLAGNDVRSNQEARSSQYDRTDNSRSELIQFTAETIPSVGYRVFWLVPIEADPSLQEIDQNTFDLENQFLKVTISPETGNISSLFDTQHQREILSGEGNQLHAFQDSGQYWDAWNIDPKYAEHPLPNPELIQIQRSGSQVEVIRKLGHSTFKHTYILEPNSPILKIRTEVDWKERHVVVKAAFPLTISADFATYEIPCGAITRKGNCEANERTTTPKTAQEKAQWEVSALGWADLSDGEYGVSLLSDCKHGYDCTPDQIRLTLLRGSEFPDPEADLGYHEFTYALYPHAGDWRSAQTVRKAHELSQPLHPVTIDQPNPQGAHPPVASLFDLHSENLILTALKQSEDHPNQWILRCYECHGEPTDLSLNSDLGLILGDSVDILERPMSIDKSQICQIRSWQIRTFTLQQTP
jgi:alpha-mannosidase